MRFARLYRFRIPDDDAYMAEVGSPSVRTLLLRSRDEPTVWLELRVASSPDALDREPMHDPALVGDLVQLAPGTFLPEGSVVESVDELFELGGGSWLEDDANAGAASLVAWSLGAALARRLAPTVPAAFLEPMLVDWLRDELVRRSLDVPGDLAGTVVSVLDALQDEIAESLAVKWPSRDRPGDPPLPGPECELRDGALHVRFGDDGDPVVELEPIPLSELGA